MFVVLVAILSGCSPGSTGGKAQSPSSSAQEATGSSSAVGTIVALPSPRLSGPMSLEKSIATRRSVRSFSGRGLATEEISQILWSGQGITEPQTGKRAAPSAGALYPIEIYVAAPDGVWQYLPGRHARQLVSAGDARGRLADAAYGQTWIAQAGAVFVIAAVESRTEAKYGARAERYVTLEAGHVCQNMLLEAVSLGLGAVPVGAFDDSEVGRAVGLPSGAAPLYLVPVGQPDGPGAADTSR